MDPVAHFRSLLRVYHKDKEGALQSLQNFDLSETVFDAILTGERSISASLFSPRDLKKLKQMGLQTENEVDLVVEFPWDGPSFLAVVAKANDTQLRRMMLMMAVDRIRKTASLKRVLSFKGLPPCTIRENPYLGPGHAAYENFIESLLGITDTSTMAGKELFELFLKSAAHDADDTAVTCVEERGIRTVFHGTNHAVMDAILKSGLDPKCRRQDLNEDYFGIEYVTSLRYTQDKTPQPFSRTCYKVLVFLIIVDQICEPIRASEWDSLTNWRPCPCLKVKSNKSQLPLAEIDLE
ncbi:unnamed protein product [Calypogeia fissa]